MKKLLIILLSALWVNAYSQNDFIMKSNVYPIVVISISDKECAMLIDTGSGINMIDESVIKKDSVIEADAVVNSFAGEFSLNGFYIGNADFKGRNITKIMTGDIKKAFKNISVKTKLEVVGILGTPAIKQLGMIIDLSRGIVTIKNEPNNLADK